MADPKEGYNSGITRVVSSGAIDSSGNYVTGGATPVAEVALAFGPIYDDGTYKYFGEAAAGTALTAALWRVSRMAIATSQVLRS